ncbi:MAG: nucleoside diphosphate kinase regulator [Bosea sp.]|nr:nucleoside diphosphate kinase regulator [Bosea sp. (in: a-proteobacteria)]
MTPLPQIIITHEDLAILSGLIEKAMASGRYAAATRLADELHRAQVVEAARAPRDCLRLNIGGQYLEERSGAVRDIVLVAGRSSAAVGLVSVLSQVGTALLGLSAGQRIGWLDPRGKPRWLRLLRVDGGISGTAPLA